MMLVLSFILLSYQPSWTMTCSQFKTAKVRILRDKNLPFLEQQRLINYFKTKLDEPCPVNHILT